MTHLLNRLQKDIWGLIWFALALLLGFSLISFNSSDPSFNSTGTGLGVHNFCGYFGSYLSDLLYQFMGLSSWSLVIVCLWVSYHYFIGKVFYQKHLRVFWGILLVITCSGLGTLHWPHSLWYESQVSFGGFLGVIITKSLIDVFNTTGTTIILWTLALILAVFYTETSPFDWIRILGKSINLLTQPKRLSLIYQKLQETIQTRWDSYNENKKNLSTATSEETPEDPDFESPLLSQMGLTFEEDPRFEEKPFEPEKEGFFHVSPEEQISPTNKHLKPSTSFQTKTTAWKLPHISLLQTPPSEKEKTTDKTMIKKSITLTSKLAQFNVHGEVTSIKSGPAVTLFEFKPNADVKISKITDLADDLRLALSSESVRIIAPIPGKNVVGIETSNPIQKTVYLKEILSCSQFWKSNMKLPLTLGCEVNGAKKVVDLRTMPHLLVAGSTGSGKSVFVTSCLSGLLFRHSPNNLRMILIDPKQVDLAAFSKIPHLLMPPIYEAKKALNALRWVIREMEKRYRSMAVFEARDLESFNKYTSHLSAMEKQEHHKITQEIETNRPGQNYYFSPQPYILLVVEEFGDLMAVDKHHVESYIVRLAQMARACGIHLILAMQSPRKDVVTGLIKTNIPGRISFKVASKTDSRIILDEGGAERLLSKGDLLFVSPRTPRPCRHHGPWLSDKEIQKLCQFWSQQAEPEFSQNIIDNLDPPLNSHKLNNQSYFQEDPMYNEVYTYVSSLRAVSTSLLQRRFKLGYPRAARLIETLEQKKVVGPSHGSKPREVLIKSPKPSLP